MDDSNKLQIGRWLYSEENGTARLQIDTYAESDGPADVFFSCSKRSAMIDFYAPLSEPQRKFFARQLASGLGVHTKITSGRLRATCWQESAVREEWDDEANSNWSFRCSINAKQPVLQEFIRTGHFSISIGGRAQSSARKLGLEAIKRFVWECSSELQRAKK